MQYKSQICTPSKYGQHIIRLTEAVVKSVNILICSFGHVYISSSIEKSK